jgi:hypothetical protein
MLLVLALLGRKLLAPPKVAVAWHVFPALIQSPA